MFCAQKDHYLNARFETESQLESATGIAVLNGVTPEEIKNAEEAIALSPLSATKSQPITNHASTP